MKRLKFTVFFAGLMGCWYFNPMKVVKRNSTIWKSALVLYAVSDFSQWAHLPIIGWVWIFPEAIYLLLLEWFVLYEQTCSSRVLWLEKRFWEKLLECILKKLSIVDLQYCVSGVKQSDSVIYIYIYTHTHIYIYIYIQVISIISYYNILNIVPCAIQ